MVVEMFARELVWLFFSLYFYILIPEMKIEKIQRILAHICHCSLIWDKARFKKHLNFGLQKSINLSKHFGIA
eukprot:snap_masked-scaffold_6-processed-gene-9.19-mRNA-1 protein AED:1.00 eAED:1.00 QI:0/0/0/0/1/1/2/0/71